MRLIYWIFAFMPSLRASFTRALLVTQMSKLTLDGLLDLEKRGAL
jgi:hypothetical protein